MATAILESSCALSSANFEAFEQLVGELQYLAILVSLAAVALAACRGRVKCFDIVKGE